MRLCIRLSRDCMALFIEHDLFGKPLRAFRDHALAHHVRGERMAAGIAEERRLFGDRLQELLVLVIDVVAEVPFCWRTVKFGVCVPDQSTECGSIGLSWASSTSMCMRDE
jgi:hypothetical protein